MTKIPFSLTCAIVLFAGIVLSAQEIPSDRVEEGKEKLRHDSTLARKARTALADNPDLINRIPADQRGEVLDVLKQNTIQGQVQQTSPAARPSSPAPREIVSVEQTTDNPDSAQNRHLSPDGESFFDARQIPYDQIFGRSLFTDYYQPVAVTEIPEDYIIMPGDEILLRLWGRYNLDKKYIIGKDGYVFIDPLSKQMYLLGMSYGQLKNMLRTITQDVPGVEGEAQILTTRTIKVHVTGEAKNPGTISIPPYYTFWQALMLTQGPGKFGSIRKIKLVRRGAAVNTLDIYSFLKTGIKPQQIVKDEDVIFFDHVEKAERISGFVQRGGWYELLADETLADLVAFAGGMKAAEFSSIAQIDRLIPVKARTQDGPTRSVIDLDLASDGWKKQPLLDGDIISTKNKKTRYQNDVFITGRGVPVPGRYSITPDVRTVWDVIQKAGGPAPGFHTKAELERIGDAGKRSMALDLSDQASLRQIPIAPGDTIRTYHELEFRDFTTVKSSGFVRQQIEVPYSDSLSLGSLLKRSGGTRDGAMGYVYVKRTDPYGIISYNRISIADTAEASNVLLEPRDEIIAFDFRDFNRLFPVGVLAYGSRPLLLEYSHDLTLSILIHRLGGLNLLVDSSDVEIVIPEIKSSEVFVKTKSIAINQTTASDPSIIVPGAMVIFRKDPRKNLPVYITVAGEVMSPGSYPLRTRKDNVLSAINQAGGLTVRANPYSIKIARQGSEEEIPVETIKSNPLTLKSDLVLNQGDRITVASNDYLVKIKGAVFDPGVSAFNSAYSWKEYVAKGAGGFLDSADVKRTYIKYPNGMKHKGRQGFAKTAPVVPGSEIVVPYKPPKPQGKEKKEFDYMKFVSFLSLMATTLLSLSLVAREL